MEPDPARQAAFGGAPPAGAPVSARERLLAAIALGARGRYAVATTLLDELRQDADPLYASLAASTLASHRRQLGGHAVARGLDGTALALAARARSAGDPDGLDAAGARCDALLGLAADNLALGRIAAARRLRAAAERWARRSWRCAVRDGWVAAEIELAAGRPREAVPPAEVALTRAGEAGAPRHAVKSAMVLAAALAATGGSEARERATVLVEEALESAEEHEFASLVWPGCLIAGDLRLGHADEYRFRRVQVLHTVLLRADAEGRRTARRSPWVPGGPALDPSDDHSDIRAKKLSKKPPDRVKVGAKASDRGYGMSPGCRKETP